MQQSLDLSPEQESVSCIATGRRGEDIARQFLSRKGYRILGMNVHIGWHGEIDIVAFDQVDKAVVFAEVKTRHKRSPDYEPELNITYGKRRAMIRAARGWVRQHRWDGGYRMDVVCIVAGAVTQHYKEIDWEQ